MRVLLRNRKTGLYLCGENQWHADQGQARDFEHAANAVEFANSRELIDVEVVLAFGDGRYDMALPVRQPGETGA